MRQRGFTYLGLLFAMAFIGLLLDATGEVRHTTLKREREAELLSVACCRMGVERGVQLPLGVGSIAQATRCYDSRPDPILPDDRESAGALAFDSHRERCCCRA